MPATLRRHAKKLHRLHGSQNYEQRQLPQNQVFSLESAIDFNRDRATSRSFVRNSTIGVPVSQPESARHPGLGFRYRQATENSECAEKARV
jgi:hypothetical protein